MFTIKSENAIADRIVLTAVIMLGLYDAYKISVEAGCMVEKQLPGACRLRFAVELFQD